MRDTQPCGFEPSLLAKDVVLKLKTKFYDGRVADCAIQPKPEEIDNQFAARAANVLQAHHARLGARKTNETS